METREFNRLAASTKLKKGGRAHSALYDVLVKGLTAAESARQNRMDQGALSRALHSFPTSLCPHCKRPMRNGANR